MCCIHFLLLYNKFPLTQWLKTTPVYQLPVLSVRSLGGWTGLSTVGSQGKSEGVGQTQFFGGSGEEFALDLITLAGQFLEVERLRSLFSSAMENLPMIVGMLCHHTHSRRDKDRKSWGATFESWMNSGQLEVCSGTWKRVEVRDKDLRVVLP